MLKFEWVVQTQLDEATVILTLLKERRPIIERQAEVNFKINAKATMQAYVTDADGIVRLFDLEPAAYLINAVVAEVDENSPLPLPLSGRV